MMKLKVSFVLLFYFCVVVVTLKLPYSSSSKSNEVFSDSVLNDKQIPATRPSSADTKAGIENAIKKDSSESYYKLFSNEDYIVPRVCPNMNSKKKLNKLEQLQSKLSRFTMAEKNIIMAMAINNISSPDSYTKSYSRILAEMSDIFPNTGQVIQIVLMGGEKAGKSTTLEYLTKTKLTYVDIKRATMAPTLFHFRKAIKDEVTINGNTVDTPIEKISVEIENIFASMSEIQTKPVTIEIRSPNVENEFDLVDLPGITADDANSHTYKTVLSIAQPYIDNYDNNIILYVMPAPQAAHTYTTYLADLRVKLNKRNNVIFVVNHMKSIISYSREPSGMKNIETRFKEMREVHKKTDEFYFINTAPVVDVGETHIIPPHIFKEKINESIYREDEEIREWLHTVKDPVLRQMFTPANTGIQNLIYRVQGWVNRRREKLLDKVRIQLNEILLEGNADEDGSFEDFDVNTLEDIIRDFGKLVKNIFSTKTDSIPSTFLESLKTEHFRFDKYLTFKGIHNYPKKGFVMQEWDSEELFKGELVLRFKMLSKDIMRRSTRDMRNRLLAQDAGPDSQYIIQKLKGNDGTQAFLVNAWRETVVDMALSSTISFDKWSEVMVNRLSYNLRQIFRGALWLLMNKHERSNHYTSLLCDSPVFSNSLEEKLHDVIRLRVSYTKDFINAMWWQTLSSKVDYTLPTLYKSLIVSYYPELKEDIYSFSQSPCTEIKEEIWVIHNTSDYRTEMQKVESCIDDIKQFSKVTFSLRVITFYKAFEDYVEATWIEPFFKHLEENKERTLIKPNYARHIDIVQVLRNTLIVKNSSLQELYGIDGIANNMLLRQQAHTSLIQSVKSIIKNLEKFCSDYLNSYKGSLSPM